MNEAKKMRVRPFAGDDADHKLMCGRCDSHDPMGLIVGGKIHYRRTYGDCWVDPQAGFYTTCSRCGQVGFIAWEDVPMA